MRGGNQARKAGNAAEAFAANLLRQQFPESVVLHLQQDGPADLAQLFITGDWRLYEVKSSKIARKALSARLTPAEYDTATFLGQRYVVMRLQRIPSRPKDTFVELSRGR